MRILQVAFLLLFNYLDSLPKLYFITWITTVHLAFSCIVPLLASGVCMYENDSSCIGLLVIFFSHSLKFKNTLFCINRMADDCFIKKMRTMIFHEFGEWYQYEINVDKEMEIVCDILINVYQRRWMQFTRHYWSCHQQFVAQRSSAYNWGGRHYHGLDIVIGKWTAVFCHQLFN